MSEALYRIAYDVAVRSISDQARTLDDLRSRAGTLFAAAALVTTFLGGSTFDRQSFEPISISGIAVAAFLATALLTLVIVWPFDLGFSLSARSFIAVVESRPDGVAVDVADAHRELAIQIELDYDANAGMIRRLSACFRGAILMLVVETAAWIIVLWRL